MRMQVDVENIQVNLQKRRGVLEDLREVNGEIKGLEEVLDELEGELDFCDYAIDIYKKTESKNGSLLAALYWEECLGGSV